VRGERKIPSAKKLLKKTNLIIFTDIDGTLLDDSYSFRKALPALILIEEKKIPLILCSSKTKAELEHCRKRLKNDHPFITENGGEIFVPKEYFKFQISDFKLKVEEEKKYFIIKLGASYSELRDALHELRSEGFDIKGFGDMSVKKVSELTGLSITGSRLAKKRYSDEPFVFKGTTSSIRKLKRHIKSKGFNYTQGSTFSYNGKQ
jgi:mannosyl-3-phosphoglycerate phosphatase